MPTAFVAPRDTLQVQVSLLWEKLLRIRPVGVCDNFRDLGGDHALAEQLIDDVRQVTGRSLLLADFLETPTVEHLSSMLKRTRWSPYWSALVSLQQVGSKPPLFLVHSPSGHVFPYCHIARHLGVDHPLYGLRSVGLDRKQTPHFRVPEMAAHYIAEMRSLQPVGPYFLGGFCFGGTVAYEMAQQLDVAGCRVELLALIDSYLPVPARKSARGRGYIERIRRKTRRHVRRFLQRGLNEKRIFLRRRFNSVREHIKCFWWNRVYDYYLGRGRQLPTVFQDIYMINARAAREYRPTPYPGRVTLLTSKAIIEEAGIDPESMWKDFAAGGLDLHIMPCDHEDLLRDPVANDVARILHERFESGASAPLRRGSDVPNSIQRCP